MGGFNLFDPSTWGGSATETVTQDPRSSSNGGQDRNGSVPAQVAGGYYMATKDATGYQQTLDRLNQLYQPGMSIQDLQKAYQDKFGNDAFSSYLSQNAGAYQQQLGQKEANDKTDAQSQAGDQWLTGAMQRIQQFADSLSKYDPNDPLAQSLTRASALNAQAGATNAGLGDRGMSVAEQARGVSDAATRYQMQRQQMAIGAENNLANQAQGMANRQLSREQFDKNFGLQTTAYNQGIQQQAYNNSIEQAGQAGNLIGSGLGALIGGAAGGPMGMQYGMQAGGSLGGGLGVASQGSTMSYPTNYYQGTGLGGTGGYSKLYGSTGYGLSG